MRSDAAGSPELLARLADVLAEAADGVRPTPLELAELLWLARHMEPSAKTPAAQVPERPDTAVRESTEPESMPRPPVPEPGSSRSSEPPRAPLHLPAPASAAGAATAPHVSLLAPAPPMLRRPLALQRALRPLKRRIDAPVGRELDERTTADRIARLGADPAWWLPVMRPAQERWLRLNLIHDAGPTMPVWRPLIRELHTVFAQSGIFRTVALHRAEPDGTVRHSSAHAPADGRTITLLISDCMGPQWREGPVGARWYATLRRWARRMPLAVVQPLPEHLWRNSALPAVPGRLSAPHPAAPTATLTFTPYDASALNESEGTIAGSAVFLPVLEAGPDWLANWASLIATSGGVSFPASAARLSRPLSADSGDRTDVARLSAEDLVLRFRATASPEAFRLAGHLSVGRPDLPVMRLVQAALEPRPRPQHLAEVILSGMLTEIPGPPGSYAFRPGVRDLLLLGLPRTAQGRTSELLARVGGLIDARAGTAPGEFRASTPASSGPETAVDSDAFATVSADSVRQLSGGAGAAGNLLAGRYRLVRMTGTQGVSWLAADTQRGDETVLVQTYPGPAHWFRLSFMGRAHRLSQVRHPGIAQIRDYGIDGEVPYLVREFVDGRSLLSRMARSPHGLPAAELMGLVPPLVEAVNALHDQDEPHGALNSSHVIIAQRGPVLTCLEVTSARPANGADDLRALGRIIHVMHRGTSGSSAGHQLPLPFKDLTLPERLDAELRLAVSELTSSHLDTQLLGIDRLRQLPSLRERSRTYSLLGPLRVAEDGHPLVIGSPDEQAMLCMLLLQKGEAVRHAELEVGIWGDAPPPDARHLVSTHAARLRHMLGPDSMVTVEDGYALHTSTDFVDVVRCQRLVTQAERERSAPNAMLARRHVASALDLWQGTPLDGVPGPAAAAARSRLLQLRLSLSATRAELDLELGEFERAATDLAQLVHEHPSREDFRRLHLIALRRQGHVEEALEAYEEYESSGGRSPDLLALGRELRDEHEEFGDHPGYSESHSDDSAASSALGAPDGFVAALDELPEGPFPTEDELPTHLLSSQEESSEEVALPEDEGLESAFATEDESADHPYDSRDEPREFPDGFDGFDNFHLEPPDDLDAPYDGDSDDDQRNGPVYEHGMYSDAPQALPTAGTHRTCAFYDFADGAQEPDTHAALGRAVTRLLTASGLRDDEYDLTEHPGGYLVLAREGVSALPLLSATLRQLRDRLVQPAGVRLRVLFRHTGDEGLDQQPDPEAAQATLDDSGAYAIVAVTSPLSTELAAESDSAPLLEPFAPDREGHRPAGRHLLFLPPRTLTDGTSRPSPVLGPYALPPNRDQFPMPVNRTRTVVFATPDGEFSSTLTPAVRTYYEVILSEHHTPFALTESSRYGVCAFTARGEVMWQVDDPVEVVRHTTRHAREADVPELLEDILRGELRPIVPNYPPTHVGEAERILEECVGRHVVPGYASRWSISLTTSPSPTVLTSQRGELGIADAITSADCVILGFNGPLTRLHGTREAAAAVRELAQLLVERRDPDDVQPPHPLEGYANPLDLLRAFADHELAGELRERLDDIEIRAVLTAEPRPYADLLVRTLQAKGVGIAVVTDHATRAAESYLRDRALMPCLRGGVHGRGTDLTRLLPHPYSLTAALEQLGTTASRSLFLGYSATERRAAHSLGLPFIAFARDEQAQQRHSTPDGTPLLVSGLLPLLVAARSR
ncbi:SAV_2336 N-terminal domain-related protein [Streptomyces sp. NPDC020898]|uniref:SAV_2336 N-terminal domain-related protein n=1 Tax=Streptomyces sp. NPDC020898 TaxID=3365101 RepID=UPI003787B82E